MNILEKQVSKQGLKLFSICLKGDVDLKITFPHLGNAYIGVKALFDGLGVDYVIPPFSNKTSLEIGSLHSPEDICLPFKINLGNYIQSIEKGADTVIITGSCGPCRFGEYCELQMNILRNLGYDVDFIVIDAPKEIGMGTLMKRIGKIGSSSTKNRYEKLKALRDGLRVIHMIDAFESKVRDFSGYETNKGECKRLLHSCKEDLLKCSTPSEMIGLIKNNEQNLSQISVDKHSEPLKIAIIGEIYTIIEPFSNLYIEDKLMDFGVCTSRKLTPSWWFKNMALSPIGLNSMDIKRASKDYLSINIGGHCRECVAEAVLAKEAGYDGAIQIFPLGCMPEIVAKTILPTISKEKDIPIMSLVVDEMTGEAGFVTRLEAFIDLLERRRQNVLSRS